MKANQILWKVVVHLALIAGTLLPLFVSYDIPDAGEHPEKHLRLYHLGVISPFKDLKVLAPNGELTFKAGDRTLSNLFISHSTLRNTGRSPILPSDFHEKLHVDVAEPWEIIAIEDKDETNNNTRLVWKRLAKNAFEAEPTLLNPDDFSSLVVYLTDATGTQKKDPELNWHVRIINLKSIEFDEKMPKNEVAGSNSTLGIFVFLAGWKFWFVCIFGLCDFSLLLFLLRRCRLLHLWDWRSLLMVIGSVVLAGTAAECSSTYIFGNDFFPLTDGVFISKGASVGSLFADIIKVDHWANAPGIVLNCATLVFLLNFPKSKRRHKSKSLSLAT